MQVNPSFPSNTVPQFIAYAKSNPGKISVGSGGTGNPAHVIGEYFKMMTGVDLVHVPYRGAGPAIADLLGGQIQVTFTDMPASIEYFKAGKLRALAVSIAMRSEALPDVPTIGQFVSGFEASQWTGVFAPKNVPPEIVRTLNAEINVGLADAKLKARFADIGGAVLAGSPAEFGTLVAPILKTPRFRCRLMQARGKGRPRGMSRATSSCGAEDVDRGRPQEAAPR